MQKKTVKARELRHKRLRKKIVGDKERPRLCIHRSLSGLTCQIIDDLAGRTIISLATFSKEVKPKIKYGGNVKAAEILGKFLAEKAKQKGITKVVFDRGGCLYHGRIKAFADACRKEGLIF